MSDLGWVWGIIGLVAGLGLGLVIWAIFGVILVLKDIDNSVEF